MMFDKLNPFSGPSAVSEVTDLHIYPIKSCRGISMKRSYVTKRGLDLDRSWMFVDAGTLKFVTIRDMPVMTLIDTALASIPDASSSNSTPTDSDNQEALVISIRDTDQKVMVPARPTQEWLQENTTLKQVTIWDYRTDGYIYRDEINDVFTSFFGKPVKLVYKGPTPRILRGNGAPEVLGRQQSTNFPDVLPLLIANESSLDDLNQRLKKKGHDEITIERFRANIIVRGAQDADPVDKAPPPWNEDSWKTVRIDNGEESGSVMSAFGMGHKGLEIDVQARCARCQVPNVDPDTAEKHKKEPWDTLVSYRRVDEGIKWKPCFGMLSVPRNEGSIAVGMKFEVVETTEKHKYIKGF